MTTEDIKDNIIKTSSRIRSTPKKQLCEVPIMDSSKDHVAGRVKIGGSVTSWTFCVRKRSGYGPWSPKSYLGNKQCLTIIQTTEDREISLELPKKCHSSVFKFYRCTHQMKRPYCTHVNVCGGRVKANFGQQLIIDQMQTIDKVLILDYLIE